MLKVEILGFNGLPLLVDDSGDLQTSTTLLNVEESDNFDGLYDSALLLGSYNGYLYPIAINESGELL